MAISTDKLSPRIIIQENDIQSRQRQEVKPPVTLMFGFSPMGRTNEMIEFNSQAEILNEFGAPGSAPEKYFIDAGIRLVNYGATALMTRLPYDNFACHNLKFVDFQIDSPIGIQDIVTGPQETKTREKDDIGVTILKQMHDIDPYMTQYQRINLVGSSDGRTHIGHMSNEQFTELELDPKGTLKTNTFRIVDIKGMQYGSGQSDIEYTGIFPIIVTAPMALYYQGKIENNSQLDECFQLLDMSDGIEMSTRWYRQSSTVNDTFKIEQSKILASISQELNFNTKINKFHRNESFQDICVKRFPAINLLEVNKLDKTNIKDIGILVCKLDWEPDTQTSTLSVVESFIGKLGGGSDAIDRKINLKSKFIRMYKNLSIPNETDYFVCDHQRLTSIGMSSTECEKYINYKTSIFDPIKHMLESTYSDIDSIQIDVILDAGLSSTAFAAYVAKNKNGESFFQNKKVRTKVNWGGTEYSIDDQIEQYAHVWNQLTQLFGDFCKNVRGDCVYIADGPRILNLERNYPIRNYTDMENLEIFNKFLPYFNGNTNNYVARYFNWVYIEDMQLENRGLWIPASVVVGSQLAFNDQDGYIWYAPAGQQRGLINGAYDISLKTKQYNQENDVLYQNQWNFFQTYQNTGVVIEGQKTMQVKKTALDRLNVRRMVCYIKQQARKIGNKYKYEPHTESVRNAFVKDLQFMLSQIERTNGISDYTILCNSDNNTISTIDKHELHCVIKIKPVKTIEYIIIDLDIMNGSILMNDNKFLKG